MKKLLLLLTALIVVSCTEKASVNCEEPVKTEYVKSYKKASNKKYVSTRSKSNVKNSSSTNYSAKKSSYYVLDTYRFNFNGGNNSCKLNGYNVLLDCEIKGNVIYPNSGKYFEGPGRLWTTQYVNVSNNVIHKILTYNDKIHEGTLALTGDYTVQGDLIVTGDLNLNGYSLVVFGHAEIGNKLNGGGSLTYCTSNIIDDNGNVIQEKVQNNPNLSIQCQTLGLEEVVTVQEYYECE